MSSKGYEVERTDVTRLNSGRSDAPQNRERNDLAPGLEKAFEFMPEEGSYCVDDIEGDIPKFVAGTYYLNGPARFATEQIRYRHWLDGDGMVSSLRFLEGRVRFSNRFVRTTKFTTEEQAGRPIFRTFGTAFAGDSLKRGLGLESPGNISVYSFNRRLLAFGEQSLPWELDPVTLETIGLFDFGGSLSEVTPFSAHPKFDATTGEMFNFGIFFSRAAPQLCIYCFDQSGRLTRRRQHALEYSYSVHDFSMSSNYFVFYLGPYLLDIDRVVRGGHCVMDSLSWEPERRGRLLITSRRTGDEFASLALDGRYSLHLLNSFEQEGNLLIDVVEFDRPMYDQYAPVPDLFTDPPKGGPVRLKVNLEKRELTSREDLNYRLAPDFPTMDPGRLTQPYRDFWMLGISHTGLPGRKFFDQLVHARWTDRNPRDIFQSPPGHYLCGEPAFIGNADAACVICQELVPESNRSAFLLFDAFHVSAGPVATMRLRERIPFGFHTSFQPNLRND